MEHISSKKIAIYGLLTAAAIIFGYVEFLLPLSFIAPGVKLGLANLICLYLVCLKKDILLLDEPFSALDYQSRLAISDDIYNILKILLSALLFATPFSLLFSLTAGCVSLIAMIFACKIKAFGIVGISVIGGAIHNIVQLLVAGVTVGKGVWFYLPFLLLAGTVAGLLIGVLCWLFINKTQSVANIIKE